jgi:hypothetical protein
MLLRKLIKKYRNIFAEEKVLAVGEFEERITGYRIIYMTFWLPIMLELLKNCDRKSNEYFLMTASSMYIEFFTSSLSKRFRSCFTKKEKKEAIRAQETHIAMP